jgi:hypothetical protein
MRRRPGACTITLHISCENRGKQSWTLHTVSAICDFSTSCPSPDPYLASGAAVLWRGPEAAGGGRRHDRGRIITVREGKCTGLAVWRLETIHCVTSRGRESVDCIGRLVEFLPASYTNAEALLACFWQVLCEVHAIGADSYGYHGGISAWLHGVFSCYT